MTSTSSRDEELKRIQILLEARATELKHGIYRREAIAGWQADDAARAVIQDAGFGKYFTHRTGHNISNTLHGNGANLDNLETHDERVILPDTCFSVEPGVYLDAFGIRSELNMVTSAERAYVTGRAQQELVRI